MKVVLYMAISANAIIARENNKEDFLSHDNWITFAKLAKKAGCMIWGRKTHEIVRKWEKEYHDDIRNVTKLVVSADPDFRLEAGYHPAKSPEEALKLLRSKGFREVILTGGSMLNSSFAKAGLIDEIILNVEPVVVGRGIGLFFPAEFVLRLKLLGIKKIGRGIVQLHYRVVK